MRGIIYKDVCLFFKGMDIRAVPLGIAALALLIVNKNIYAGMLFSVMLNMLAGAQNILVFEIEEKVEWRKYQRTFPVDCGKAVAGKYAAVLIIALLNVGLSMVLNLAAFTAYRTFSLPIFGVSALMAVLIPVAWAVITLPVCYWFGFRMAQYVSVALVFPVFFTTKNFEEGMWTVSDIMAVMGDPVKYLLLGLLALCGAYLLSLAVSTAGYCRRK